MDAKTIARFWSKVEKTETCWLWTGATSRRGYGTIHHNGKCRRATHVSWEMANGREWPDGMYGCHTCDNPNCVRPEHVFPGTQSDNLLDASRKGRLPKKRGPRATPCKRGHSFPEHFRLCASGWYHCRSCERILARVRKQKARLARVDGKDGSDG